MCGRRCRCTPAQERLASTALDVVPASNSTRANAWFGFGVVQKDLGNFAIAASAFDRALSADASRVDAATQLVWCLLQANRVRAAAARLEMLSKALPSGPWWPFVAALRLHFGSRAVVADEFAQRLAASPAPGASGTITARARAHGVTVGVSVRAADGDGDPVLPKVVFASSMLKHAVCSSLDFILNDKVACNDALRRAGLGDIHSPAFALPHEAAELLAAAVEVQLDARCDSCTNKLLARTDATLTPRSHTVDMHAHTRRS